MFKINQKKFKKFIALLPLVFGLAIGLSSLPCEDCGMLFPFSGETDSCHVVEEASADSCHQESTNNMSPCDCCELKKAEEPRASQSIVSFEKPSLKAWTLISTQFVQAHSLRPKSFIPLQNHSPPDATLLAIKTIRLLI